MAVQIDPKKPVTVQVLNEAGDVTETYTGAGKYSQLFGKIGTPGLGSEDWLTEVFVASKSAVLENLKTQVAPSGGAEFGTSGASLHTTVVVNTADGMKVWRDVNVLADGKIDGQKYVANIFKISTASFETLGNHLAEAWNINKNRGPQ